MADQNTVVTIPPLSAGVIRSDKRNTLCNQHTTAIPNPSAQRGWFCPAVDCYRLLIKDISENRWTLGSQVAGMATGKHIIGIDHISGQTSKELPLDASGTIGQDDGIRNFKRNVYV
ncbi:jg25617 [Pararge aegeria aegeria]|uniref:Jg25617 protein n=1 Tax=Pararge aegeria aegeria TaxID=348720 RepID=A0A8S4RBR3_9NEOP|nr:jg25617 [Pararge aegeria aegeria]